MLRLKLRKMYIQGSKIAFVFGLVFCIFVKDMNIAVTKLELAKRLLDTNDKAIINHIKAIFSTQSEDWWEELPTDIKASVTRGLKQSENGQTIPHNQVMKNYKKWLKK